MIAWMPYFGEQARRMANFPTIKNKPFGVFTADWSSRLRNEGFESQRMANAVHPIVVALERFSAPSLQ
jgi:hypothetical protein